MVYTYPINGSQNVLRILNVDFLARVNALDPTCVNTIINDRLPPVPITYSLGGPALATFEFAAAQEIAAQLNDLEGDTLWAADDLLSIF